MFLLDLPASSLGLWVGGINRNDICQELCRIVVLRALVTHLLKVGQGIAGSPAVQHLAL